jgi:photosystem II stability/assembly factor-like uncharacterized protein
MSKLKVFSISLVLTMLLIASNSFAQWTFVGGFPYSASYYPQLSVVDANTLWVCGGTNTPVIYKSTNGGVTWTSAVGSGVSVDVFAIWAVDANTAYVGDGGVAGGAGGNAKVYKTTNGGTTWTIILSTGGSAGFINGIKFSKSNPQIGVAESDPPSGAGTNYWWQLTTNGGTSWTQINGPALGSTYASAQGTVVLIDQNFFGVGSSNGSGDKVIWTTNGGTSWNNTTLPLSGTQAFVSTFTMNTDKMHGVASRSTSLPSIGVTSNGCVNFSVSTLSGLSSYCTAFWVPGTDVCYVWGQAGNPSCYKTTNAGSTWTTMTSQGINGVTSMDAIYNSGTGDITAYAVATDGSCLKLSENLTGIIHSGNNVPAEYSLSQNYPNPFNPTTKINFALPKASNVSLKVYDVLGHEVMTLVNEYKTAGSYTVNVDASALSSGIYFYTIKAGDFADSKKMTLIK